MSHIAMVKCVTHLPPGDRRGDKLEVLFPVRGGLSIATTETERRDGEYYTPVGIEIDVSGGLRELDADGHPTDKMVGGLVDPRNGEPYTGVTIHIPANGDRYTQRKGAYCQWKAVMEMQHGWHFADVVYMENSDGKTVDAYRWPLKSKSSLPEVQENISSEETISPEEVRRRLERVKRSFSHEESKVCLHQFTGSMDSNPPIIFCTDCGARIVDGKWVNFRQETANVNA